MLYGGGDMRAEERGSKHLWNTVDLRVVARIFRESKTVKRPCN